MLFIRVMYNFHTTGQRGSKNQHLDQHLKKKNPLHSLEYLPINLVAISTFREAQTYQS